jgi:hypothetical protein
MFGASLKVSLFITMNLMLAQAAVAQSGALLKAAPAASSLNYAYELNRPQEPKLTAPKESGPLEAARSTFMPTPNLSNLGNPAGANDEITQVKCRRSPATGVRAKSADSCSGSAQ